jgi:hypothetical protein
VSTDGWTASSKLEKYLLLGSAVLKQDSPLRAYYYDAMTPWLHYAPFYAYSEGGAGLRCWAAGLGGGGAGGRGVGVGGGAGGGGRAASNNSIKKSRGAGRAAGGQAAGQPVVQCQPPPAPQTCPPGDIVDTVTWLRQHDERARRIARSGKRFATLHLHRQARLCYYKELFSEMSQLYKWVLRAIAHAWACGARHPLARPRLRPSSRAALTRRPRAGTT